MVQPFSQQPIRANRRKSFTRVGLILLFSLIASTGPALATSLLSCSSAPAAPRTAQGKPSRSELIAAAREARVEGASFELLDGWVRLIEAADAFEAGDPTLLSLWLRRFPSHPGQGYAGRFGQSAASGIVALLPLSGPLAPAGQAVADGLRQGLGGVELVDTGSGPLPVAALAERFAAARPSLVIGPLTREQVAQWAAREPPFPTLALNLLPDAQKPGRHFMQFSLAPEEEGRALAERVVVENGRACGRLLVEESELWQRFAEAFSDQLRLLGGCLYENGNEEGFLALAGTRPPSRVPFGLPLYGPFRAAAVPGLRMVGPPFAAGMPARASGDRLQLEAFARDAARLAAIYLRDGRLPDAVEGESGRLEIDGAGRIHRALLMLRNDGGMLVPDCR